MSKELKRIAAIALIFAIVATFMPQQKVFAISESQQRINQQKAAEFDLLCRLVYSEARGESEYGQRLVVDVVLNRVDSDEFPNTIEEVICEKDQFAPVSTGVIYSAEPSQELRVLVFMEMKARSNSEVIYFRTNSYHDCGTPLFPEGNHFFSAL